MAKKELEQADMLISGLTDEKTLNLILLLNQASEILEKEEDK
ncbi:MAG TPA: hypothetical protein PK705_10395 [Clostridia bacterium]|jgi:hypothetical protein|nr:hypothetical protein [Clostridia bacterium]